MQREYRFVGIENSLTPSTSNVRRSDHREDDRCSIWSFFRFVQNFPKALQSSKNAVGTI